MTGPTEDPPATEPEEPQQGDQAEGTDTAGVEAAAGADGADGDPDAQAEPQFEGPRRRARREREERRAAQSRAQAIETARRDAKRRARALSAGAGAQVSRGAVRGVNLVLAGILVTLAVIALGLVLYFTPVMSARTVVVVGTGEVTQDEVLAAARVEIGTPLLQINTDAVADRVATIRQVASARVQREYPSTLRVTITERVPVAVKDFPDGPHLYDRDGVDFVSQLSHQALPYLDVDNPGPADPPTKAALAVLTSLRPEIAAQVGRVAAPSVASITLTLADGRVVVWGTDDRTDEKAEKLAALLTQPGRTFDVSSPDLPTVK